MLEPVSKTNQAIALWNKGLWVQAFAIFSTFKLGFTKEQRELLKICHEMNAGNTAFYERLGYSHDAVLTDAEQIIRSVYSKQLTK